MATGTQTWRFITARPIGAAGDLGGTEQAILHLSAALAARGHRIVADHAANPITVAINNARLFPPDSHRPIVWFHNEVTLWRECKRGRLPALRRQNPLAVFCGAEQQRRASLPFLASRTIIPHGLPETILTARPAATPPPPHAIFASQAYRGLAEMIGLWRAAIGPQNRQARFTSLIAPAEMPPFAKLAEGDRSVAIMPRIPNAAMPALFAGARLLLAPGHVSETFCLAAAEAIAMGVPVVTLGLGALKERVADGRTGFVCRNLREMAERTLALLTDDALWSRMQAEGLATRQKAGWGDVAQKWEELVAGPGD